MATSQALSHTKRVQNLYKNSSKLILSWMKHRSLWYDKMAELRAEFESNRHVDKATAEMLLAAGEQRLKECVHPEPYINPESLGGSKFARNPPVQPGVSILYDFGKED